MAEIVSSSDTLNGKARIKGTRVSAEQIYEMHTVREMSPEEIAEEIPSVNIEQVKTALEYMDRHRDGEALEA